MDLFIFTAVFVVCMSVILIGIWRFSDFKWLVSLGGIFILILTFTAMNQGITQKVVANETTDLIYGNQTNYLTNTQNSTTSVLPFNFTANFTPVVAPSISCVYLSNQTSAHGYVYNELTGTIVVQG